MHTITAVIMSLCLRNTLVNLIHTFRKERIQWEIQAPITQFIQYIWCSNKEFNGKKNIVAII